jgi:REP element-mobilizing transposase RayT
MKFAWQARFYDHIIRNEKSLENIRTYIVGNPAKWAEDEYFQIFNP